MKSNPGAVFPVVIMKGGAGKRETFTLEGAAGLPGIAVVLDEGEPPGLDRFLRGRTSIGRLAAAWGGWIAFALSVI